MHPSRRLDTNLYTALGAGADDIVQGLKDRVIAAQEGLFRGDDDGSGYFLWDYIADG